MIQKLLWFTCGLLAGLMVLSISKASVPPNSGMGNPVTDDTALYQRLSEIRVKKEAKIDFDSDIRQLSALESRYQESLPSFARTPKLSRPMQRVSEQKYRFSGKSRSGSSKKVNSRR